MTDSLKLAEMQRTSIEFERQRHLANWFIKSSPHMATPSTPLSTNGGVGGSNGTGGSGGGGGGGGSHHHPEGRKPKLRRFNSHDTSANMFSVADFENARLARRNEIEMKQRLQHRMKVSSLGSCGNGGIGICGIGLAGNGGDCSTGDSKGSKYSNDSQTDPLPADIFLDRYSLPRVVRISYKTKFSHETLQSSSSTSTQSSSGTTGSSSSSTGGGGLVVGSVNGNGSGLGNNIISQTSVSNNPHHNLASNSISSSKLNTNTTVTTTATTNSSSSSGGGVSIDNSGELFLLYRLIRQRHIYHGYNSKTGTANRKKGVMMPQEFPGYFSLLNDKGLPTATLYTSLIQLVRERVYKFVSVDNLSAFTESQPNPTGNSSNGCSTADSPIPNYGAPSGRPQYVKTTARGGQVFRLLAVFEDGKQDSSSSTASAMTGKTSNSGRDKEKGRYAQLLNENRQVLYVSLSTKGKFYEIEPGIPQILQKLGGNNDANKKVNPDCVHRITALINPQKELPMALRFISGPAGCANTIPENITITRISTENIVIACPIEDVEAQSPLHLRKLHLTAEMTLLKSSLGFENEQRMLANQNVQNILKFCQFNCDQFLKMVEIEILNRPERSASKSRVDGLKILKPLHLPKLLRREKTSIAHEKEDSIIFLSKNDLANLESKEEQQAAAVSSIGTGTTTQNRISDKMKVFQSTKKKWFRRNDKHNNLLTSLDLDVQAKRMSMERYNDMSKLLQERFGENQQKQEQKSDNNKMTSSTPGDESISERSASEIGCSDTETTMTRSGKKSLKPILQKSMSLQDVGLCGKPDLLSMTHAASSGGGGGGGIIRRSFDREETISEAATDPEDFENQPPQSFITEKLYTEFHVKTRQYSKSSSSLHQLLHFAVPQKMNIIESKRSLAQLKQHQQHQQQQQQQRNNNNNCSINNNINNNNGEIKSPTDKKLEFNIGEPVTGRRAAGATPLLPHGAISLLNGSFGVIEDDLPYSSVRDSLVLSSDESSGENHLTNGADFNFNDYTKENIYAEICHDAVAMGGIPSSHRDYAGMADYATIAPPAGGSAISRVQINCSPNSISYHTVFFGAEPLGRRGSEYRKSSSSSTMEKAANVAGSVGVGGGGGGSDIISNKNKTNGSVITSSGAVSHVTVNDSLTNGGSSSSSSNKGGGDNNARDTTTTGRTDNIYNTLK